MAIQDFVDQFADIAEHSAWVAELAQGARPFADRTAMIDAFVHAVTDAPQERQLALLRAHPDLAGRAALAGDLTEDSQAEQAGAGLDQLSAAEFAFFTEHNANYNERFGFPFIFAVRGATKQAILASFQTRLQHDAGTEFATALKHVCRIVTFRLEDRVTDTHP